MVPGVADAEAIQLNKSHASLVKFDSADDDDYAMVSGQLQVMTHRAIANIKQRWRDQHKQRTWTLLHHLLAC